jgi:hypothetical protein
MFVHGPEIREAARALIEQGVNDCEVARRLGIARTTVRDWRRPRYVPDNGRAAQPCPRCWRTSGPITASADDYAELLGLYLGDGHITQMARTQRLRIFLDASYPTIVDEAEALLRRVFPNNRVCRQTRHAGTMVVLLLYHGHLACLLPQHGAGKKHQRRLAPEPWQSALVAASPWRFLRGCIRSDGCVFINRTGPYEYLSYDFTNLSSELLELFASTAELVGLHPRRYAKRVRLYRREDVRRLAVEVGTKQ